MDRVVSYSLAGAVESGLPLLPGHLGVVVRRTLASPHCVPRGRRATAAASPGGAGLSFVGRPLCSSGKLGVPLSCGDGGSGSVRCALYLLPGRRAACGVAIPTPGA